MMNTIRRPLSLLIVNRFKLDDDETLQRAQLVLPYTKGSICLLLSFLMETKLVSKRRAFDVRT